MKNALNRRLLSGLVFSVLALNSAQALADYAPGDPVYDLWASYYQQEKSDPATAETTLLKLTEKTPDNVVVWKTLMYLRLNLGHKEAALDALHKARALAPDDEQLALQEAYLLNDLKRNQESLQLFEQLTHAHDAKIAETACQAVVNLRTLVNRKFQPPYFADVYSAPSYEGRYDDGVVPFKARIGRYYGDDNRGQVYGFTSINRDTQSRGGARPEVFDDNSAIVGAGANYRVFAKLPIIAYLELGGSYDLIDRNRARFRESVVGGITGFQEWGDVKPYCGDKCHVPLTLFADLYGNVATYSREDYNVLADARFRFGVNLLKSPEGRVQGYIKLHTVDDSKQVFYDNIFEYGPGLAYHFPTSYPLVLRVESLSGHYLAGGGSPGAKETYHNNRVELTVYKSF